MATSKNHSKIGKSLRNNLMFDVVNQKLLDPEKYVNVQKNGKEVNFNLILFFFQKLKNLS